MLNTRQAAKLLAVHPNTLAVWRQKQKYLPFIQVGRGYVRYRREDVEALLRNGEVAPDPARCPQTPEDQADDPAHDAQPQSFQSGDRP